MKIKEFMKENGIEIDDVRWFLAEQKVYSILEKKDSVYELIDEISSKRLEAELFDMEERFVDELQDSFDRNFIDEADVREVFYRVNKSRFARQKNGFLNFQDNL
ncbi:MAG: hypothetical protein JXR63_13060 [Spirochaetales bacterium]|nr:hypothetical protein [Spirochaetales bacterium]